MSAIVQFHLMEIKKICEDEPGTYSISELADRFDLADCTVQRFVRENSLNTKKRGNPNREKIAEFIKANRGLTARIIAAKLREDPAYIANMATRIGVKLGDSVKVYRTKTKFFDYEREGNMF
jgi:hypothetical protein